MNKSKLSAFSLAVFAVIVLDQISKYVIRTTPTLHNYQIIEGWLAFHYTQNPGMALGISWADTWIISLIAIVATVVIIVFIFKTMQSATIGYMICMGLIIGGALGNIIDRLFMARIENYGTFLDGHVVDFIHFTLTINGFRIFPYIFNIADAAISVSIFTLILFYKQLMPEASQGKEPGNEGGNEAQQEEKREQNHQQEKPRIDPPEGSHREKES
ncbi:MAG: signal peptidase II [Balneolales bacterium]